jgi:hypothetical protein
MDSTSKTFMVVRFEKSGATALDREDIKTVNWDQFSSSLPTVPPPSLALIKEHFRIALLLHVRGFGRRAILI